MSLLKSRPHLSQSAVEFLLGQLQTSCDEARALVCHALAAIASHLPVLGDGMVGPLVELYRVACHSATDMQQELLVRGPVSLWSHVDAAQGGSWTRPPLSSRTLLASTAGA